MIICSVYGTSSLLMTKLLELLFHYSSHGVGIEMILGDKKKNILGAKSESWHEPQQKQK